MQLPQLTDEQRSDLDRIARGVVADHPDWARDSVELETIARLVVLAQEGVEWAAELVFTAFGHALAGSAGPEVQAQARSLFAKRV